jgi:hypothetical protein
MKIKYLLHRSKQPFARHKEDLRRLTDFYARQYSGLTFIDKGLRFSLERGPLTVDFDFGYVNMRYRDFSAYDRVIAQSAFSILNREMNPGDLAIPTQSAKLRINSANSKVRVYQERVTFENPMSLVLEQLQRYETRVDASLLQRFITTTVAPYSTRSICALAQVPVRADACIAEANRFFYPSKLQGASVMLNDGRQRLPIDNLQEHLEGSFDGVNCEVKQMFENARNKLAMFAVGLDKPYHGFELPRDVRFGEQLEKAAPTYSHGQLTYLQGLLIGYLLETESEVN